MKLSAAHTFYTVCCCAQPSPEPQPQPQTQSQTQTPKPQPKPLNPNPNSNPNPNPKPEQVCCCAIASFVAKKPRFAYTAAGVGIGLMVFGRCAHRVTRTLNLPLTRTLTARAKP